MPLLDGLTDFVASILAFFYSLPVVGSSYGWAIILLTFTVMIILMPLTLKATRSTIKMQQLQPELRRIQKEYKQDREQLNVELMKLYSDNGVNPVGGCLPLVAQMPVFLVLFRVLQGLTRRVEDQAFYDAAVHLRELQGLAPINGELFAPQYLQHDTDLYIDLTTHTEMGFGPLDLSAQAWDVVQTDFVAAIPYLILIAFVVGASYYQQKQVMARRSDDSAANSSPMMQQQQQIMKFLPLMTGGWSLFFPAGLPLYWATSSLFRIGQQAYITHQIYGKEAADLPTPKTSSSDKGSSRKGSGKSSTDGDSGGDSDSIGSKKTKTTTAAIEAAETEVVVAGDKREQRRAEWEARRKKSEAKKSNAKKSTAQSKASRDAGSSRVTPKGTKPGQNKSKRKR